MQSVREGCSSVFDNSWGVCGCVDVLKGVGHRGGCACRLGNMIWACLMAMAMGVPCAF